MIKLELKHLAEFLNKQELECSTMKHTKEFPFDYLFVHFGTDRNDRDWIMQIRIIAQVVEIENEETHQKEDQDKLYQIQFMLPLPFETNETCFGDLARLILLINKLCTLSGFELSEADKLVFFRYTYLLEKNQISEWILTSIISNIVTLSDIFAPYLESIADGKRTLAEAILDIEKDREK